MTYAPFLVLILYALIGPYGGTIGYFLLKSHVGEPKAAEWGKYGYAYVAAIVTGILNPMYSVVYCQSVVTGGWGVYLTILLLVPLCIAFWVSLRYSPRDFSRVSFLGLSLPWWLAFLQIVQVLLCAIVVACAE